MRRRANVHVNGWGIRKLPNSFGERVVYECYAVDADGYRTLCYGFHTKREAVEHARKCKPPAVCISSPSDDIIARRRRNSTAVDRLRTS